MITNITTICHGMWVGTMCCSEQHQSLKQPYNMKERVSHPSCLPASYLGCQLPTPSNLSVMSFTSATSDCQGWMGLINAEQHMIHSHLHAWYILLYWLCQGGSDRDDPYHPSFAKHYSHS